MPLYELFQGQTLTIEGPATVNITSSPNEPEITGEPIHPNLPPPVEAEPPTLTALSPNNAIAGDAADIVMVCEGTGFTPQSVIVFNGFDEPTTFISDTEVSTGVKPSLFVVPAVCPVLIRDGANETTPLDFSFTEPAARSTRRR